MTDGAALCCHTLAILHFSGAASSHVAVQRADRRGRPPLHGHPVRHRLLRRPPADQRGDPPTPARLGLQSVAGGLLHQLDLLRRGRPGHRPAVVVRADLPRPAAAAAVHAADAGQDDPDQQAGEHHLDRRLHRRALRQVALAGDHRRPDLPGRRAALHRPAAQGHRPRRQPAHRRSAQRQRHRRPGHRADRLVGAGAVHHPVRHAQPRRHRAPPRHGDGGGLRVAGQAAGLPRRRRVRHLGAVRRRRRPAGAGAGGPRAGGVLAPPGGLDRHGSADRGGDDGDHLPAAAVPRHRGGEYRAARPQPGALGISPVPGAGGAVRGADRPRRAAAAAGRVRARLLRHQPAAGRAASEPRAAGLHRRRLGGHRHGDRGQRGAVDHDLQRHAAALAAAPAQRRAAVRGVPPLAAVGAAHRHHRPAAAGLRDLPDDGAEDQPGQHRPDRLRRRHPARPGDVRRAVLETGQQPRRVRRPGGRRAAVVLHPAATAGGQRHGLVAGYAARPALAGRQPAGPADGPGDPGHPAVAAQQLPGVRAGLAVLAHPRLRTLAGQPFRRPGGLGAADPAPAAGGAGPGPVDAGGTLRRRGARAAELHPLRLPPGQGLQSQPDRQRRMDRPHRAPARRCARRLLGARGGQGGHRRPRDAGRGRGAHRRRGLRGPAVQPRPAAGRDREHLPGHQRGRPVAASGGLEPPLPGTVRVPRGADQHRPADRRHHPLQRRARPVRQGRPGHPRRQAPVLDAPGYRTHLRAHLPQRPGDRTGRQPDARRRLRHVVHRHHRPPPGRGRAQGGQREPRAARRRAHPGAVRAQRAAVRGQGPRRGRQPVEDPFPRRGQPRPDAAAQRRAAVLRRAVPPGSAARRGARTGAAPRLLAALGRGPDRRPAGHLAPGERPLHSRAQRLRPRHPVRRPRRRVPRPGPGTGYRPAHPRQQAAHRQRSEAATPGTAELPDQRLPLRQGQGAARRAPRRPPPAPGGVGPRPRHPGRQAQGDLRGVQAPRQPPDPRREGPGPGPGDRRRLLPGARAPHRGALLGRQGQRVQRARAAGPRPRRAAGAAGGTGQRAAADERRPGVVHRQRGQHPHRHAQPADPLGLPGADRALARRVRASARPGRPAGAGAGRLPPRRRRDRPGADGLAARAPGPAGARRGDQRRRPPRADRRGARRRPRLPEQAGQAGRPARPAQPPSQAALSRPPCRPRVRRGGICRGTAC
ncbi:hypothetical protein OF001_U90089 [Pseudomonas sp. OF001]|nr:hypothetical protein OF001_U90089 [Pseudomonas sp. OF001]